MPRELFDLDVMEVSLVDDPANQEAHAVLFKSASGRPGGKKGLPDRDGFGDDAPEQKGIETEPKGELMAEDQKLAEAQAKLTAAEKARDEAIAARDAEKARADAYAKALSADGYQIDGAKVAKPDPSDFIEIEGEKVLKSEAPAWAIKMAERVKAQEAEIAETRMKARVESEIPHMAGDVSAKAALLSAVDGIADEDCRKAAAKALEMADAAAKSLKSAIGHRGDVDDATGSEGQKALNQLDEMAKARAAEKGEAYGVAYAAVVKTAEGAALFAKRNLN